MEDLLEVSDAARILNLTPAAVRALAERGALRIAVRTPRGQRLFRSKDVESLAQVRAERRAKGSGRELG